MSKSDEIDAQIEAAKTAKGGWTRAQFEEWGVPWPPKAGWRKALRANGLPDGKTIGIADAPFVGIAVPVTSSPISEAYWQTDAAVSDIAARFGLKSGKAVTKQAGPAILRGVPCRHCGVDITAKNRGHATTEIHTFNKSYRNRIECYSCFRKVRDEQLKKRWSERKAETETVPFHPKFNNVAAPKATSNAPSVAAKEEFYASWEWRTVRMEALKEHGRACQCCGAEPGMKTAAGAPVRICVDHIKPLSKFWHLRLQRSNLQVLCDECNQGKGNWDQTDFRKPAAPDEWIVDDVGVSDAILAQLTDRTTGRLQ